MMKIRILGKDLKVSAVGLGCMGMTHASGAPADVKEMTELVGQALKHYRDKIVLATKCGVQHKGDHLEMDSRPETIRKSVEGSLKKLQTDHIGPVLSTQDRSESGAGGSGGSHVRADQRRQDPALGNFRSG